MRAPLASIIILLLFAALTNLALALAVSGVAFMTLGSVGVWRMPDTYCRMHALSKATTLGVAGVLVALGIQHGDPGTIAKAALGVFFLILTIPVGTHAIGRAAYIVGFEMYGDGLVDDWMRFGKSRMRRLFLPGVPIPLRGDAARRALEAENSTDSEDDECPEESRPQAQPEQSP